MESFQPGLSFSLCDEAEIILRLHGTFSPDRVKYSSISSQDEISAGRKQ